MYYLPSAAIRTVRRQGEFIAARDFEDALRSYYSTRGISFPGRDVAQVVIMMMMMMMMMITIDAYHDEDALTPPSLSPLSISTIYLLYINISIYLSLYIYLPIYLSTYLSIYLYLQASRKESPLGSKASGIWMPSECYLNTIISHQRCIQQCVSWFQLWAVYEHNHIMHSFFSVYSKQAINQWMYVWLYIWLYG